MNIPKCKECEFYLSMNERDYYINKTWDIDCNPKINLCIGFLKTDSEGYQTGERKVILAKYMKTSPKWCPKRVNN